MYHSSGHSPMDWWAACKSRRKSGWVPGAVGAKDKIALSIIQGKHGITLLDECASPRNQCAPAKTSFSFKFRDPGTQM